MCDNNSTSQITPGNDTSRNNQETLAGVIGFLVCLVLVAVLFIIWLFIDRRRKQREIYRLTMFSIGFPHEDSNHVINPATPQPGNVNSDETGSGNSPQCPARSIIPAIMRYHSRQLSNEIDKSCPKVSPTRQQKPRALSVDVLSSGRMTAAASPIDDYATIRSFRRDKATTICETPTDVTSDKTNPETQSVDNAEPEKRTGARISDSVPVEEETISATVQENEACILPEEKSILRSKHEDINEDSERRYSLVRMRRFAMSPITSSVGKSPRVSCNLLDEISNETDIKFLADNKKRRSDRKSDSSSRKCGSSGVYEDIEAPPLSRAKQSVTSDDFTEISDLSSSNSAESDLEGDQNQRNSIPLVVVTPADGTVDNLNDSASPSSLDQQQDGEWLGFESEDTLLI